MRGKTKNQKRCGVSTSSPGHLGIITLKLKLKPPNKQITRSSPDRLQWTRYTSIDLLVFKFSWNITMTFVNINWHWKVKCSFRRCSTPFRIAYRNRALHRYLKGCCEQNRGYGKFIASIKKVNRKKDIIFVQIYVERWKYYSLIYKTINKIPFRYSTKTRK